MVRPSARSSPGAFPAPSISLFSVRFDRLLGIIADLDPWNTDSMNALELTGRARTHVVELDAPRCTLHYEAVAAFLGMRDAARTEGIDLQAVSSFRDFERQLLLWNRKWRGERPLHDRNGALLDLATLSEPQRVDAILAWSAIPGGSRHHWGSDIDVIDVAAMPAGYQVQLVPAEYAPGGVFSRLTGWLDRNMGRFGYFRPYGSNRGGAGIEPWHLIVVYCSHLSGTLTSGSDSSSFGESPSCFWIAPPTNRTSALYPSMMSRADAWPSNICLTRATRELA